MSKGGSYIHNYQQILTDVLPFGRLNAGHKAGCILNNTDFLLECECVRCVRGKPSLKVSALEESVACKMHCQELQPAKRTYQCLSLSGPKLA